MKYLSVLPAIFAAAVVAFGAAGAESTPEAKENYQFILLGDLHYDAADIRVNNPKRPFARNGEYRRNIAAWKEKTPALLKAVAARSAQDIEFTVQCGDLTQGDEGSYEFASTSFQRALQMLTAENKTPVYVVRGNHDVRGKGKRKACAAILKPYMAKLNVIFPPKSKSLTSYKVVGKDLFIFFDSESGTIADIEAALQAKPDRRHLFFVTHVPVVPCLPNHNADWICFRHNRPKRDALHKLLAANNAIVLAAHTHLPSLFHWKTADGTITQFVSFSIPALKNRPISRDAHSNGSDFFTHLDTKALPKLREKTRNRITKNLAPYRNNIQSYEYFRNAAGFNVLRVVGNEIFADIYTGNDLSKPALTVKIK